MWNDKTPQESADELNEKHGYEIAQDRLTGRLWYRGVSTDWCYFPYDPAKPPKGNGRMTNPV